MHRLQYQKVACQAINKWKVALRLVFGAAGWAAYVYEVRCIHLEWLQLPCVGELRVVVLKLLAEIRRPPSRLGALFSTP